MSSGRENAEVSTLIIVLRVVSLAAFAAPMLLSNRARHGEPAMQVHQRLIDRAPLVANLTAFGLFFLSLLISSRSSEGSMALPLALSGCMLALTGAILVLRSRAELGSAWSLLPRADRDAGLITTGPYRFVRHPIYLGLTVLATGNALGFGSYLAFLIVLTGIVPTFVWRARVEELQLSHTFGERFALYRRQTKMIIPHLL
jgi:protein-S-isoprenylcysteine O-methyltransferase Ste14